MSEDENNGRETTKVLGVFNVRGRGNVFTCKPDRIITMETVRIGLHVLRVRDAKLWTIIGVERHCIPPRADDTIGLLVRDTCDLVAGDNIKLINVADVE